MVMTMSAVPVTVHADMEYFDYSDETIVGGALHCAHFHESSGDFISILSCDTEVTEATIPSEIDGVPVTIVLENAFKECTSLEKLTLDTNPGTCYFMDCEALREVYIGENVTSMFKGTAATFSYCTEIVKYEVDEDNQFYTSIDGVMYTKEMETLVRYPSNREGSSYNIPASVETINTNAFSYNQNIKTMDIPDTVTTLGDGAFLNAKGLTSVNIPGSIRHIENYAFDGCTKLSDISIGNGVEEIGQDAFAGLRALVEIAIPESVTTIGNNAFYGWWDLERVSLSSNITSMGDSVFSNPYAIEQPTIYCDEGSYAYNYAVEAGLNVAPLSDPEAPVITPLDKQKIQVADAFTKCYGDESFSLEAEVVSAGDTSEATGAAISYVSRNPQVADISDDGVVTVGIPGSTVIEVRAAKTNKFREAYKEVKVTVSKAPQSIEGTGSVSKAFNYNGTFSVRSTSKTPVTYKSSNTNIATVNSQGLVTMKNPGSATIYITAPENEYYKSASKKVPLKISLSAPVIKVKAYKGRKIKISWSQVPGAHGYKLYMYDSKSKKYKCKVTRKAYIKSVTHKGLKKGKKYKYKVRAYRVVNGKTVYGGYSSVKWAKAKR